MAFRAKRAIPSSVRRSSRVQLVERSTRAARRRHFQRGAEQLFKVLLDLPFAAFVPAGKGRWIEDDRVEFFTTPGQSG